MRRQLVGSVPGTWGALTAHSEVKAPHVKAVAKRGSFFATDRHRRGRSPVSVARTVWNGGPSTAHAQPRVASPERARRWARPGARAAARRFPQCPQFTRPRNTRTQRTGRHQRNPAPEPRPRARRVSRTFRLARHSRQSAPPRNTAGRRPGRRRPVGRVRRSTGRSARPRPAPRLVRRRRRGAEPRGDEEPGGDGADRGQRRAGQQRVVQPVDVLLRRAAAERGLARARARPAPPRRRRCPPGGTCRSRPRRRRSAPAAPCRARPRSAPG